MKRTLFICLSIIMLALVGCNKDKNSWGKLEQSSVVLEVGKTVQLNFNSDGNKCPQWSSEDEFIATVNSEGLVTAMHVGQTTIRVNNLPCTVIVTDEYDKKYDIDVPFAYWGVSDTTVQSYELAIRGLADYKSVEDTVWETVLVPDTVYTDSTHTHWDITTKETQVIGYIYIKSATYDYTISITDLLVNWAEYRYGYTATTDKKTGVTTYTTQLNEYEYKVEPSHNDDVMKILDNRYYKMEGTSNPTYMYYDVENKACYIVVKTANDNTKHIIVSHNSPQ